MKQRVRVSEARFCGGCGGRCVIWPSVALAAREIKSLIEDSVGKVDVGSTLVESAGETMAEIVSAVTRVTSIMGEIASASDQASRGMIRLA
ncbi:methyl-accepting chemotaxis protein [Escherichia coli]